MTLNLVLTFHWYAEIESGRKRIEYRAMSPHWTKQIWDRRDKITHVRFQRGYTKTAMTFAVDHVNIGTCPYEGWGDKYYRIVFTEC
jgi:hypothetical protein